MCEYGVYGEREYFSRRAVDNDLQLAYTNYKSEKKYLMEVSYGYIDCCCGSGHYCGFDHQEYDKG